jgi:hypothetical protein
MATAAAIPPLPVRTLLRDDPAMRLQRRVGLAPADGLGVARRAAFWGLFCWLPVAAWALASGRAFAEDGESLLAHYSVTLRLLVAVPLMVVAEGLALRTVLHVGRHFAATAPYRGDPAALRSAALELARLRDRVHPVAVAVGLVLAWFAAYGVAPGPDRLPDELAWAGSGPGTEWGVHWYLWVARPIFIAFVAVWLWRAVLLGIALRRIASLGVAIVPTHPDRAGGWGFVEGLPRAFGLVAFALSAVVAGGWAHQIAQHGASVGAYRVPMAMTVGILTAVFLAPLVVLVGPMARAKRTARLQYGALVARHGDGLHRRWILGEAVSDPLLEAPEVGAAADAATLYEAVCRMRPLPIGAATVASVALPAAAPMVAVLAMQVPIATMLQKVLDALL